MKYFDIMNEFCNNMNIEFNQNMYKKFILFMEELIKYNNKFNLTSIVNEDEIIKRHFLDSISLLNYNIDTNSKVCDVGTGAGFPGIPLKILRSDLKVDLLESTTKKTMFLQHIIKELKLYNVNIINDRVENVSHETLYREKYDYVISRAMARLNKLIELSFALVNINGKYIALKGNKFNEELLEANISINKMGGEIEKIIPINEFNSNIIIIKKIHTTDIAYPRKYNLILKKPL